MIDPLHHKVRPLKRRSKKKPLSEEIRSVYKLLSITLATLAFVAFFSYLYVNSLKPAKGYQLKQLQLDYEELQSEKRNLERKIIDSQSFINLEKDDSLKKMENAENNEFTYVEESPYAAKIGN